ncbi:MAG: TonB-dependent receptor [Bacteroidales bacterium]|nr:TonB-dependent receptor [Bacteroidales bacterium]
MKYIHLVIALLSVFGDILAQNREGRVLDANQTPLEAAHIQIVHKDSIWAQAISKADGTFQVSGVDVLPIFFSVSHVACEPFFVYIDKEADWDKIKEIRTQTRLNTLEAVEAVATKPFARYKGEAIVFDVADKPQYTTMSADKMLKFIPGIILSGQGAEVFGHGAEVFVDGHKLRTMDAAMVARLLRNYPAEAIQEVEVNPLSTGQYGSTPGSAYVNIITKSTFLDGAFATIQAEGLLYEKDANIAGGVNANLLYTKGKFSMIANLSYDHENIVRTDERALKVSDIDLYRQYQESHTHTNMYMANFSGTWRFDNQNRLTASVNLYDDFSHQRGNGDILLSQPTSCQDTLTASKRGNQENMGASLDYQTDENRNSVFQLVYSYQQGRDKYLDNTMHYEHALMDDYQYDADFQVQEHDFYFGYDQKFSPQLTMKITYANKLSLLTDSTEYDPLHLSLSNLTEGKEWNMAANASFIYQPAPQWFVYFLGTWTRTDLWIDLAQGNYHIGAKNSLDPMGCVQYTTPSSNYRGRVVGYRTTYRPNYLSMIPNVRTNTAFESEQGNPTIQSTKTWVAYYEQWLFQYLMTRVTYFHTKEASASAYFYENQQVSSRHNNYYDWDALRLNVSIPFRFWGERLSGNLNYIYTNYSYGKMINGYALTTDRPKHYWRQQASAAVAYQITPWMVLNVDGECEGFSRECYRSNTKPTWNVDATLSCTWGENNAWGARLGLRNIFDSSHSDVKYFMDGATLSNNVKTLSRCISLGIRYQFQTGKQQNQSHSLPIDNSRM